MQTPPLNDPRSGRQHALAVLQARLVTFLWSTSWVLIKIGLDDLDIAPLSFAGLRYALAALILLPFGIRAMRGRAGNLPMDRRLGVRVAIYGLLFVAVAQGAQFAALSMLPATAVSPMGPPSRPIASRARVRPRCEEDAADSMQMPAATNPSSVPGTASNGPK